MWQSLGCSCSAVVRPCVSVSLRVCQSAARFGATALEVVATPRLPHYRGCFSPASHQRAAAIRPPAIGDRPRLRPENIG